MSQTHTGLRPLQQMRPKSELHWTCKCGSVCPLTMAVRQLRCVFFEHSLCLSRNTESAWRWCGCPFPRSSSKSQPQCLAEDPGWRWTHWGKDSPGKAGIGTGLLYILTDLMTHNCKISVLGNNVVSFNAASRYSRRQNWRWYSRSRRYPVQTAVSLGCYCLDTV